MSRTLFQNIQRCLRLHPHAARAGVGARQAGGGGGVVGGTDSDEDIVVIRDGVDLQAQADEDDGEWRQINGFVDAFNDNRLTAVIPGAVMTVDESMSMWLGQDGDWTVEGMPHVTKIIRKPRGVGAEFKNVCDGDTGIMMRLELQKGKDIMKDKPYVHEYGAGTAVMMRLLRPWGGTGRTAIGDSAFGSVKTLQALHSELGFFSILVIKTAHKQFPKQHLAQVAAERALAADFVRGEWTTMTSSYTTGAAHATSQHTMFATAWMDKRTKYVLSNRSTGNRAATDSVRSRHKIGIVDGARTTVKYEKTVQRPEVVQDLYKCFSRIDVHDHFRQGSLNFEEGWKTKCWWHRLFSSMLGMTVVDAFLAQRYDNPGSTTDCFSVFCGRLCHQLIHNIYLERGRGQKRHLNEEEAEVGVNFKNPTS